MSQTWTRSLLTTKQVLLNRKAVYVARWDGGMSHDVGLKFLRNSMNKATVENLRYFYISLPEDGTPVAQRIDSNGARRAPASDDAYECAHILHEIGFDVEVPAK